MHFCHEPGRHPTRAHTLTLTMLHGPQSAGTFSTAVLLGKVRELLHGSLAGSPADLREDWSLASRQS